MTTKNQNVPYKIYLTEEEMPKYWFDLRPDMINKPAPLLRPDTLKPCQAADLAPVFCDGLIAQELNETQS